MSNLRVMGVINAVSDLGVHCLSTSIKRMLGLYTQSSRLTCADPDNLDRGSGHHPNAIEMVFRRRVHIGVIFTEGGGVFGSLSLLYIRALFNKLKKSHLFIDQGSCRGSFGKISEPNNRF